MQPRYFSFFCLLWFFWLSFCFCATQDLEHEDFTLLKNELKYFRDLLSPDQPASSEREVEDEEDQRPVREGALKITLHVLKKLNHSDLANTLKTSKSA